MIAILDATQEIRCLVLSAVSVAASVEQGQNPDDINLTLALLQRQINDRCALIDEACRSSSPSSNCAWLPAD